MQPTLIGLFLGLYTFDYVYNMSSINHAASLSSINHAANFDWVIPWVIHLRLCLQYVFYKSCSQLPIAMSLTLRIRWSSKIVCLPILFRTISSRPRLNFFLSIINWCSNKTIFEIFYAIRSQCTLSLTHGNIRKPYRLMMFSVVREWVHRKRMG